MRGMLGRFLTLLALAAAPAALADTSSLLTNGDFAVGQSGWALPPGAAFDTSGPGGSAALHLTRQSIGVSFAEQTVPLDGSRFHTVHLLAWVRCSKVVRDAQSWDGVQLPVHFLDAAGQWLPENGGIPPLTGSSDWRVVAATLTVPPQTVRIMVRIGLANAVGDTWFMGVRLTTDREAVRSDLQQTLALLEKRAPQSLALASCLEALATLVPEDPAARGYRRRALALREKLEPPSLPLAQRLQEMAGVALWQEKDAPAAAQFYGRALAMQEKLAPNSPEVVSTLYGLGGLFQGAGDYGKARQYYQQALTLEQQRARNSMAVASALTHLGGLALSVGDSLAAKDYFQQALAIEEKLAPGSPELAEALKELGTLASQRGDLATAQQYFQRALVVQQEKWGPDSVELGGTLHRLGNLALQQGDLVAARWYLERALPFIERMDPSGIDNVLCSLGQLAGAQGDQAASEAYIRRAVRWDQGRGRTPPPYIAQGWA